LLYSLQQGPTEKTIIDQAVRGRKPLPDAIANAPDLNSGLELYYVAFMDLTSSRALGATEGPIAWNVIDYYCRVLQFSEEQREDAFFFIAAMDKAYLDFRAEKPKSKVASKKGKG
jgi:hypothetical protein